MILILLLVFGCSHSTEGESSYPMQDCKAQFTYVSDKPSPSVAVIGDFNGWSSPGYEMTDDGNGNLSLSISLGGGRNAYRYLVDGESVLDTSNPLTIFGDDGQEHSLLIQEDCHVPRLQVLESSAENSTYTATLEFLAALNGMPLDAKSISIASDSEEPGSIEADPDNGIIQIRISASEGKHHVAVKAADEDGNATPEILLPFWIEEKAFDWDEATIYQIVVDRFRNGEGSLNSDAGITSRFGGDYAGLVETIREGYFDRLGINTLWISPAYRNVEGYWPGFDGREYEAYHGYWPVASREVDPHWGGEEALDALVQEAHGAGMRVILDVVPNHVHAEHPGYLSHRYEWFNHPDIDCVCGRECNWMSDIDHCWFTEYLPDYDWKKAAVVEKVIPDTIWWLTRFDLDGLRVDAVPMMPRLATRHMRYAADQAVGQGGLHTFLIGETFTGEQGRPQIRRYLGPMGLSGQFDFPLMWALRRVIAQGEGSMSELSEAMDESDASWEGSGAVMGHIIGNHDVPRFISMAAGNGDDVFNPPDAPELEEMYARVALAMAIILTIPGAPVIYYGDEFGMPGAGDPDNRRPMRFAAELSQKEARLLETVSRLGILRKNISAFRHGKRWDLKADADTLAYMLEDGQTFGIVLLSRSGNARKIKFEIPSELTFIEESTVIDCLGSSIEKKSNEIEVAIPPFGVMVLSSEDKCNELAM